MLFSLLDLIKVFLSIFHKSLLEIFLLIDLYKKKNLVLVIHKYWIIEINMMCCNILFAIIAQIDVGYKSI